MHESCSFSLLAAATLLISAAPLTAHSAELPARGPIPFASYDLNHDGAISPGEFNQVQQQRQDARMANGTPMRQMRNAPSFEDFDTNADDQLSPEELRAGQQAQREKRMQQRNTMRTGQGMGPRKGMAQRPRFDDMDANGNGKIDADEFEAFHDKRMQQRSDEGRRLKRAADAPSFKEMDANGDGNISRSEFMQFHRRSRPMGSGRQGN
jgi:Ca2+-binding EF-hand superfamily protein